MKIHNITASIKAIVLGLVVATGVSYIFAWTGPTATPPNNDVPAPINVGLDAPEQQKLGGLFLNTGTSSQDTIGLDVWGKTIVNGALQLTSGTMASGSVLTSDASGNASWQSSAASAKTPQMVELAPDNGNALVYRGNLTAAANFPSFNDFADGSGSSPDCPSPNSNVEQKAVSYPSSIPSNAYAIEIRAIAGSNDNGYTQIQLASKSSDTFTTAAMAFQNGNTWDYDTGTMILPYNPARTINVRWSTSAANCNLDTIVRTDVIGYFIYQ